MFIVTMARLNVRLRTRLFHSLLLQDIAFFDKNRWVAGLGKAMLFVSVVKPYIPNSRPD
jgi:hypothetical protein